MRIDQEYVVLRIDEGHDPLREHPDNPNKGVEETIDESIEENGWFGAVVVQKSTGYILAGNHRYRVAKQRGAREIPVIWKDVDDETAKKILLVDNESTRQGEWDEAKLEELLAGLDNLKGTGFVLASAQEKIESEAADPKPEPEGNGLPTPDEIPDDDYTPQYGVILTVDSEERQREVFDALFRLQRGQYDEGDACDNGTSTGTVGVKELQKLSLRVVAV